VNDDDDDLALQELVPAAFSRVVKKPVRDELKPFTFEAYKGREVIVRSNGFTYRGVLIGADEDELYLRSEMRWIVLPLSQITDVKPDE
jgi:hypothetical protein